MGYYTSFTIVQATEDSAKHLCETSGYEWSLDRDLWDAKWYHWKDHLDETSKTFPDELIILEGVGEEYPDIWRAYAKGGVVEVVKGEVVFPKTTLE